MRPNLTWPLINLVAVAATVGVNALANLLPLNEQTTGEIIDRDPVRFLPAGWVFSVVWGAIYLGLASFAAYGLSQRGRDSRIGPLFALSSAANITWLFLWHWERLPLSMVAMLVLLFSLIGIYWWGLRGDGWSPHPDWIELLAVWAPFSLYLAWVSVATIANSAVVLDRADWGAWGLSDVTWATILVVAAAALALAYTVRGDIAFAVIFVVAFIGIATRQSDAMSLAFTAWVAAALIAIAAVARFIRPLESNAVADHRERFVLLR